MPTIYTYTSLYPLSVERVRKEKKIAGIIKTKRLDVCIHVMKPNVNSDLPIDFKLPWSGRRQLGNQKGTQEKLENVW